MEYENIFTRSVGKGGGVSGDRVILHGTWKHPICARKLC
jgi:hypothetical protein